MCERERERGREGEKETDSGGLPTHCCDDIVAIARLLVEGLDQPFTGLIDPHSLCDGARAGRGRVLLLQQKRSELGRYQGVRLKSDDISRIVCVFSIWIEIGIAWAALNLLGHPRAAMAVEQDARRRLHLCQIFDTIG